MANACDIDWLQPREAVLHRPDALLGSNDLVEFTQEVFTESDTIEIKTYCLSPIFMKLCDELVVNALDAAIKDESLKNIKITFEEGTLTVFNDGRGIPVEKFKGTERYIPEIVFTELNAGSNFDDSKARFSGGRNGVGAACAAIWSEKFDIDIRDANTCLTFKQTLTKNMSTIGKPSVKKSAGAHGHVKVTFLPDYARLRLTPDSTLTDLIRTRAYEAAVCARKGVNVTFNGIKLKTDFKYYAQRCIGENVIMEEQGHFPGGPCITFGVVISEISKVKSFVNGTKCPNGTLTTHIYNKLTKAIGDAFKTKFKGSVTIKPATVKAHVSIVAVALIPNPRFDSQNKDTLSTPVKEFGFTIELSTKFLTKLAKSGLLDKLHEIEQSQQTSASLRKTLVPKSRDVLIDKYDAALWSRSHPQECTLLLTEGDSAKALAVAGISVLGRERFGIFPLRGVLLNTRNCPLKKSLDNAEIHHILQILNVAPGKSMETLRYHSIGIFTDQDADGAHICGLLINFIAHMLPEILTAKPDFIKRITTPLLRATHRRTGVQHCFLTIQDFDNWCKSNEVHQYDVKYYKGLGTSSTKDAKEIFKNLEKNTVQLLKTEASGEALLDYFDDSRIEVRKDILTNRYSENLAVDYTQNRIVPIEDFLNLEMIHFSAYHVHRALPAVLDGLTPSRRKALYYFLQQSPNKEYKVAQAAAGIAQTTMYLHGENSLVETVVSMAQDYVGTNNVALLVPCGQFGSRNDKPSVHAAARYIYTYAAPIAHLLFPTSDLAVLKYREEEGQVIEPEFFVPVLPTLLLNGASGIGTGFATDVPAFSLKDVCRATRQYIRGEDIDELTSSYDGFTGAIEMTEKGVTTTGTFERIDDHTLVITELSIGRWTESALSDYKAQADGSKKKSKLELVNIVNLSTDVTVKIELTFASDIGAISDEVLIKELKLSSSISMSHMNLFDSNHKLTKYTSIVDIVKAHGDARLKLYHSRKNHQISVLEHKLEIAKLKVEFIALIVSEQLTLKGVPKVALIEKMLSLGLKPVPQTIGAEPALDFLLEMPISSCTAENMKKLSEKAKELEAELKILKDTTVQQIWENEINLIEKEHVHYVRERIERNCGDDKVTSNDAIRKRKPATKRASAKPVKRTKH
jgi:DNA topoisomerase II